MKILRRLNLEALLDQELKSQSDSHNCFKYYWAGTAKKLAKFWQWSLTAPLIASLNWKFMIHVAYKHVKLIRKCGRRWISNYTFEKSRDFDFSRVLDNLGSGTTSGQYCSVLNTLVFLTFTWRTNRVEIEQQSVFTWSSPYVVEMYCMHCIIRPKVPTVCLLLKTNCWYTSTM